MTPNQYLILFFLALSFILFNIIKLIQISKLNKQLKELRSENEALRGLQDSIEESHGRRN